MAQYSSPLPDYLAMWTHERKTYPGDMADGELLEELTKEDSTYDAFEKDIAVLNFFYGDPEFVGECLGCLGRVSKFLTTFYCS